MEPIKINIEVNLGKATIELLQAFAPAQQALPVPTTETQPEPKHKTKKEAPAPEPEPEAPAVAPADDDDLPPDDAPAPKKTLPTEDDARKAVKAARDRGVPAKTIKALMKDSFDIASSVECPAERRQELIDELNKLAA